VSRRRRRWRPTRISRRSPTPYGTTLRLTGFVNQISVQAASPDMVQTALRQVTDTLMRRHHIRPGETTDFAVRNLSQIAETAEGSSRIMALLLATVASISLLVGGIGIMNILLVSVAKRTREIGLRRRSAHGVCTCCGSSCARCRGVGADIAVGALADAALACRDRRRLRILGRRRRILRRKASHLDPIEALRYE